MNIHKVNSLPGTLIPNDIYLEKTTSGVKLKVANVAGSAVVSPILKVKLEGPTTLYHGQVGVYVINDYTPETTYTISSAQGTISRSGNQISFSVTNTGLTQATFIVNGRTFTVALTAVKPNTPKISSPVNNATNVALAGLTITSNAFSMNWAGSTDTHLSSDWEISTNASFTALVHSSYNNTTSKTSYVPN